METTSTDDFVKVYRGRVKKVSYQYDSFDQFKRVGAEIFFERGSVIIHTEKTLSIAPNTTIHFTAFWDGELDSWVVEDLVKIDRQPVAKQTRKQMQLKRLKEAVA